MAFSICSPIQSGVSGVLASPYQQSGGLNVSFRNGYRSCEITLEKVLRMFSFSRA